MQPPPLPPPLPPPPRLEQMRLPPLISARIDDSYPDDYLAMCSTVLLALVRFRRWKAWFTSAVLHCVLILLLAIWTLSYAGEDGLQLEVVFRGNEMEEVVSLDADLSVDSIGELTPTFVCPPAFSLSAEELSLEASILENVDVPATMPFGNDAITAAREGTLTATAGSSAGGPSAGTQFFGIKASGRKVVYVFDRSDSMNSVFQVTLEDRRTQSLIISDCAKTELLASLANLDEQQRFQILFYNHEVCPFLGRGSRFRLVPASNKNIGRAEDFVRYLQNYGRTLHLQALEAALKLEPDVIYLLTDGEAQDDPSEMDLTKLRRLNKGKAAIHVVLICPTPRIDSTLIRLAEENGGQHRFLNLRRLYESFLNAAARVDSEPEASQPRPSDPTESSL